VDDHPSVGEGTKAMIEMEPDMKVTIVNSGVEALALLENNSYDIMMFDLNMPVISGLELTRRVFSLEPNSIILIYSGYDISANFNLLVDSGISGLISKTATREQLITAIRCAYRGEAVIPIALFKQLRRSDVRLPRNGVTYEEVSISEKEQQILHEVAKGRSNREIASSLFMSQRTVEYNLTRIFEKLNVRSRSEAIVESKRLGLVQDDYG
jgi:two-component system competent response regulator ComA